MTTEYLDILYWSQITDDNVSFRPVFFFHPRTDILAFLEDRRYRNIPVFVRNTDGLYDGFHWATMDKATGLGACPSDADPTVPVYAATLPSASFTVYPAPPFVGEFTVLMDGGERVHEGFEEPVEEPPVAPTEELFTEPPVAPIEEPQEEEAEDVCLRKTGNKYYAFIIVFMLVLILLIVLCFLPKK
jgi:hypothetical protein